VTIKKWTLLMKYQKNALLKFFRKLNHKIYLGLLTILNKMIVFNSKNIKFIQSWIIAGNVKSLCLAIFD